MSTNYSTLPNSIGKNNDWISQAEAARMRGVSRQAIAKLVKKGRLKTFTIGGHTLVSHSEVLRFKPSEPGRKKSKSVE